MPQLTLLERVDALETRIDTSGKTPAEIEIRSILTNLGKLLNTCSGNARIDLDLGMPNLTEYSEDSITVMMEKINKSIVRLVSRYERRLSRVTVKTQADQSNVLGVYFTLEGVLPRHGEMPVFFRGTVKPGGRITITS